MRVRYLTRDEVLEIHDEALRESGGLFGVRDLGTIDAAIATPQQQFGGRDLYETVPLKAAAFFRAIAYNHPFADGNKRTAIVAMAVFLRHQRWDLRADRLVIARFAVRAVAERWEIARIARWIERHVQGVGRKRRLRATPRRNLADSDAGGQASRSPSR